MDGILAILRRQLRLPYIDNALFVTQLSRRPREKGARKGQPFKAAPVGKRKAPKTSEQEFVRQVVSKVTGVNFEGVPPHPAFPLAVDHLDWFMRCRNKDEIAKVPYLNAVWKKRGAGIWLESLAIGDTIDWIEIAYGDQKAGDSLDIDYSRFDDPAFQEDFKQKFPIVLGRIKEYGQAAADTSKKRKVHVEIRRAGSKGMLVFTIAALVKSPKSATRPSLRLALRKSVFALREAYQRIESSDGQPLRPLRDDPVP